VWQVLLSVGNKKPPNFAFAESCNLSEYFPSFHRTILLGAQGSRSTVEDITKVMLSLSTTLLTFYAIDRCILFQFLLINLGNIIFGHAHFHSHAGSRELRAEYCIVNIPHNSAV